MASVTLRNNDSVDIHASKLEEKKIFAIQVKTNQSGIRKWVLSKKVESIKSDNLFFVFVALKDEKERPEFFIIPSKEPSEKINIEHQLWLKAPGKKGQAHQANDMRNFTDPEGKYLERWDLLV